ncbi:MAG: tRNA lysidine(34) synthetase TilS [Saprospiraceae bacterium]
MLRKFQKFIESQSIVDRKGTTLIAVSGGIDSVVLCHLYHKAELSFAIAHCNYKLRGVESDEDERFVESLAQLLNVQVYKIAFNTENISTKEKASIQLIARQLRYNWFDKLVKRHNFSYLATAHHMNDRIETFLYNFTKGTGIKGLRNIKAKTHNIIRPLLFASKSDILQYAKTNNLSYRTDQSNASLKYNRNKIRLKVLPILQEINPALEKTSKETFQHLEETEALYNWAISQHKNKLFSEEDNKIIIDFKNLKKSIAPKTILYELIQPFEFSKDTVNDILDGKTRTSGAQFFSTNYRLLVNRDQLIITKKTKELFTTAILNKEDTEISFNETVLEITELKEIPSSFPKSNHIVFLDAKKLEFPLTIRRWQPGDYFYPFGMKGQKQKLKKFLTNQKLSIIEKENVYVLLSNNHIVWVIGMRSDERYKVMEGTSAVLRLEVTSD